MEAMLCLIRSCERQAAKQHSPRASRPHLHRGACSCDEKKPICCSEDVGIFTLG
jgi:hypothetical protein